MVTCPHCGSDRFTVGRPIRIWQTLEIDEVDDAGGFEVLDDELHDTLDEEPFEEAKCLACDRAIPLADLFPPPSDSAPTRQKKARRVRCTFCGDLVDVRTAHRHQGTWVGDDCCWDERLRSSE
jgi:DNA-directed RNA polymerase subunit RPC12/RpoP